MSTNIGPQGLSIIANTTTKTSSNFAFHKVLSALPVVMPLPKTCSNLQPPPEVPILSPSSPSFYGINDDVICDVCHHHWTDPVVHTLCYRVFCKHCISCKTSCPYCHKSVDSHNLHQLPPEFDAYLNKQTAECPACHMAVCVKDMAGHQWFCPTPCPNHCTAFIRPIDMTDHIDKACPFHECKCPAQDVGCAAKIRRNVLADHLQNCPFYKLRSHLRSLEQKITDQNEMLQDYNDKVNQLQADLEDQKHVTVCLQLKLQDILNKPPPFRIITQPIEDQRR